MALPKANLIKRRVRSVSRVSRRSDGNVYDEPLHKFDYGPRRVGASGPLNEKLPVFSGTYDNYRRMDRSPFLAMAKEWKLGPVYNAQGTWMARDDNVPDERVRVVQDYLEPHIAGLMRSLGDGLSMGNSPNWLRWGVESKTVATLPNAHWVVDEILPLTHDSTAVLVEEADKTRFAGLSTEYGELPPSEVIYFRYDPRPYDGYWWYGRSLHENHRDEFIEYREDRQLMHKLTKKLAGVVAIAKVIKGLARDSSGKVITSRFQTATEIVQYLAASMGVAFETVGVTEDELKRNPKLADISDISVEALDLGSSSPAFETILKKRMHSQRECVMGYLVPPPAVMDVMTGGKADTEEKSETGLTQSEVVGLMLHEVINKQLVNPFLILNYGPDAADTIYRAPTKFTEAERLAADRIMSAIVNQPEIFRIALKTIDIARTFRATNTPTRERGDTITWDAELDKLEEREEKEANPPIKPEPVPGSRRTQRSLNRGVGNNGN